jgi:serine-type D-Ala-D-Ala carboxypeptidase (penicillin-binding protein 5/6)
MEITITQKILLALVFSGIKILQLIEKVGSYLRLTTVVLVRGVALGILFLSLASSFPMETIQLPFSNIPTLLNPESSVLGAAQIGGPTLINEIPLPYVTATAIYAIDPVYEGVFVDVNSEIQLAPASTTKLMTALVSMDLYELDELVPIPHFCTEIEGQKSGFYAGDSFFAGDLIKSLLINSSADAACALSVGKITYYQFVNQMNAKVKELMMENTNFSNPIGLDGTNGEHLSTARDLYTLSLTARENPFIKETVSTVQTDIVGSHGLPVTLVTTNDLLSSVPGTVGIKTGRTEAAGEVLIYEYNLDDKDIIIVVMGSSDRFGDTVKILRWILQSYEWVK